MEMNSLKCGKEIVEQLKVGSFCRVHAEPQHDSGSNDSGLKFCSDYTPCEKSIGRVFKVDGIRHDDTYTHDLLLSSDEYVDACYLTPVKRLFD